MSVSFELFINFRLEILMNSSPCLSTRKDCFLDKELSSSGSRWPRRCSWRLRSWCGGAARCTRGCPSPFCSDSTCPWWSRGSALQVCNFIIYHSLYHFDMVNIDVKIGYLLFPGGGSSTASCPGLTASHSSSAASSPAETPTRTGWSDDQGDSHTFTNH